MEAFGTILLGILAFVFVVLLSGLIFLVTYNNGPAYLYNLKKAKYGNAIAFLFWIMMVGIAFLAWSKLFPVLTFTKPLGVKQ